jgi:hypothetical protein
MATSQLTGSNFSLDGETIEFFGVKGFKRSETSWVMNLLFGAFVEVSPDSIMDVVRDCIAGDIENGNEDKIAMLLLGPSQAVVFYLEGQMTREHVKNAVEGKGFVDLPNVEVDGRTLTIRVLGESECTTAMADSDGNILP